MEKDIEFNKMIAVTMYRNAQDKENKLHRELAAIKKNYIDCIHFILQSIPYATLDFGTNFYPVSEKTKPIVFFVKASIDKHDLVCLGMKNIETEEESEVLLEDAFVYVDDYAKLTKHILSIFNYNVEKSNH